MSDVLPTESRWTVIRKWSEPRKNKTGTATTRTRVEVQCSCEAKTKKIADWDNVRSGRSLSCGCLRREQFSRNGKFGVWDNKSFKAWKNMLERCNLKHHESYPDYGGRGIYVCPRWCTKEDGYEIFLADMGEPPSKQHSLGRKENNGPYSPENCRWETRKEQERNKRSTHNVTVGETTMCIAAWAEYNNIPVGTIHARIRIGWSEQDAVTKPLRAKRQTRRN